MWKTKENKAVNFIAEHKKAVVLRNLTKGNNTTISKYNGFVYPLSSWSLRFSDTI